MSYEQKVQLNAAEIQTLSNTNTQLKEQLQFEINEKLKISDKIIAERKHMHGKINSLQGMIHLVSVLSLMWLNTEQIDELQDALKTSEESLDSAQTELSRTTAELDRVKRDGDKERRSFAASPSSPLPSPSIITPSSPSQPSMLATPVPTLSMANRLAIDEVIASNDIPSLKRELKRIFLLY